MCNHSGLLPNYAGSHADSGKYYEEPVRVIMNAGLLSADPASARIGAYFNAGKCAPPDMRCAG